MAASASPPPLSQAFSSSKPPLVATPQAPILKAGTSNYSLYLSLLETHQIPHHVKSIHARILKSGLENNVNLCTLLYGHYTAENATRPARNLFSHIEKPDLVSWNLLIKACSRNGRFAHCMDLFGEMQRIGFAPDEFTYPCVLNACSGPAQLPEGRAVHGHLVKSGFQSSVYVSSALIHMYASCAHVGDAKKVFDEMGDRDLVSWNSIITGFVKEDKFVEALKVYCQMRAAGVGPNRTTLSGVLSACGRVENLHLGEGIHGEVVKLGEEAVRDVSVNSSLVFLYAKCGQIDSSWRIFESMPDRNEVSWNAVISGYVQNKKMKEAWDLFQLMQLEDVGVGEITITSIIVACDHLAEVRMMHAYAIKMGLNREEIIRASLVEMYGNSCRIDDARSVFDEASTSEMGAWNSMMLGYVRNGHPREALMLFSQLQERGLKPDQVTLVGVLTACANLGSLDRGQYVHDYIISNGIEVYLVLGTAIIDMYSKCGSVEKAMEIFRGMGEKDLVTWSVIISGLGMNGQTREAADLFSRMVKDGFRPDNVTFTSLLSACSHSGLVEEGWDFFNQMTDVYHLQPEGEQYACMVDLLGRAGRLDEAFEFIKAMPVEPGVSVWGALLGACRIHNNMELGSFAAQKLFELDPKDPGYYVLLSNIYAFSGRRTDAQQVRDLMKSRDLRKPPGCSWVELGGKIHQFCAGDESHPQSGKIYHKLEELQGKMTEMGYVPDTNLVLHDVEEEVKEELLNKHSERLAIAFGLINTDPSQPIRVTKNLRVCPDCHHATKLMSKIVGRKIIVRDSRRFHHFENGVCSCGDYW